MFGRIKLYLFNKKWRKRNSHNSTGVVDFFDMDCVEVGNWTYGGIKVMTFNKDAKLKIGNFCSIGPEVCFILSADHYLNKISSFPFKVKCIGEELEGVSKGDIVVDDDVWIGYGATIMSGVHIGQGAIVAAGAVVSKDVPPYSIVGGVPAKVIKYRFPQDMINELLKVDYSKLTKELIDAHLDDLYQTLEDKEQLDWMPKGI